MEQKVQVIPRKNEFSNWYKLTKLVGSAIGEYHIDLVKYSIVLNCNMWHVLQVEGVDRCLDDNNWPYGPAS
jgi:hypothetical protein